MSEGFELPSPQALRERRDAYMKSTFEGAVQSALIAARQCLEDPARFRVDSSTTLQLRHKSGDALAINAGVADEAARRFSVALREAGWACRARAWIRPASHLEVSAVWCFELEPSL